MSGLARPRSDSTVCSIRYSGSAIARAPESYNVESCPSSLPSLATSPEFWSMLSQIACLVRVSLRVRPVWSVVLPGGPSLGRVFWPT